MYIHRVSFLANVSNAIFDVGFVIVIAHFHTLFEFSVLGPSVSYVTASYCHSYS